MTGLIKMIRLFTAVAGALAMLPYCRAQGVNFTMESVTVVDLGPITVTKEGDMYMFPEEIDIDLIIDGVTVTQSRAHRHEYARPIQAIDSDGVRVDNTHEFFREAFYVDATGSYILKATEQDNGTITTELTGMFHLADQDVTCTLLVDGQCVCVADTPENQQGECITVAPPGGSETNTTTKKKRQSDVSYTDYNASVALSVVFVMDKSMVDSFIALTNTSADAISMAMDYFTALMNEVNFMYRSLGATSSSTNITLFEAGVYYPAIGTELSFLNPYINTAAGHLNVGGVGIGGLQAFGNWVQAGGLNNFTFDAASLFTRLDITRLRDGTLATNIIGTTYRGTLCTANDDQKVSIIKDVQHNTAWTLAHELAHGLSARHDGDQNTCENNKYLMAGAQFEVSLFTSNTWNTFSACSIQYIMNHLSNQNCPLGASEEDFYDNLCLGTRGEMFDINYQCKRRTGNASSVACHPSSLSTNGGKVTANSCKYPDLVRCSTSTGCDVDLFMVYGGTPCVGNTADDHVCHRGSCVQKANICASRPVAAVEFQTSGTCSDPCTTTFPKSVLKACCATQVVSESTCCGNCVVAGSFCRPRPSHECICVDPGNTAE